MANVLPGGQSRVAALKAGGQAVAMVGDGVTTRLPWLPRMWNWPLGNGTARGDARCRHYADAWRRGVGGRRVGRFQPHGRRKIGQNLFWAFAYNVAGIPLAASWVRTPVVAGAAMAMSSVSVMSNALLTEALGAAKE